MAAAKSREATHPSPQRDRVSLWLLIGGLAAGPAAWIAQLVVSYGLASHACFPSTQPWLTTPPPGWAFEAAWLTALNLICLSVAVAGALVSWRLWRRTRHEMGGDTETALEIGEGRTRFIAHCGILTGTGFAVAIAFATLQPFLLASCWRILP